MAGGREIFLGYCERGHIHIFKEFCTEKELVVYALGKLESDIWAKAHLIAWTWNEKDIEAAERELERMHKYSDYWNALFVFSLAQNNYS